MVHARGRRVLLACISLAVGFPAFADKQNPDCVIGYKRANAEFFAQISDLENKADISDTVKWTAAVGGAICVVAGKTLAIKAMCGVGAAAVAVPAHLVGDGAHREVASLKDSLPHEDSFLIYQAYSAKRSGLQGTSPEVTYLLSRLEIAPARSEDALEALKTLIEDGSLCDADGNPATTFDQLVEKIRSRL